MGFQKHKVLGIRFESNSIYIENVNGMVDTSGQQGFSFLRQNSLNP